MSQTHNLETEAKKNIYPAVQKELGIKNVHAAPRIEKVKINVGIGSSITAGNKDFSNVIENIAKITGQKPVVTKAKKAISNFKIREDNPVGITVTLRGEKMYDFINKLVHIAFPRVRDFRGITNKSFDGRGNYSVGIKECTIFPEINPDDLSKVHGLQISVVTSAENDEAGYALLKAFGFPFREAKAENNN